MISQRCEYGKETIKLRHQRKLEKSSNSKHDERIQRKWVANISNRQLNKNEIALLRKGMNFSVTPKQIPSKEILASIESAIDHLPRDSQDEIRSEVYCALKNAKPPAKENLTLDEKQALKDLQNDDSILILKADKGNCTVVMNTTDYENKVYEMFDDQNTYQLITDKRRNLTKRVESDLQKKLLDLKKKGNLSEAEYKKLRPYDSTPAAFYGLTKIHKVELKQDKDHLVLPDNSAAAHIPLRAINSSIGAPTYAVAKHLASLLKHLKEEKEYSVKNANEFSNFIQSQQLADDEIIVSFDVTSLFTSIPVDMALDIVKRKLKETNNWKSHTNLTQDQLVGLLAYVLNNSYFTFKGKHYHQISGCTMGSQVSAVIAELLLQEIEKKAIESSPVKPKWWRRYMDDVNTCLKKQDIETFHNQINSIDRHIQFTIEMPSLGERGATISFLDASCTALPNGSIEVAVHRKVIHTNKYLAFDSHSPAQHKRAVVETLMSRQTIHHQPNKGRLLKRRGSGKTFKLTGTYTTVYQEQL